MQWQDIVISLGQWAMTLALLPSLFGKNKPAVSSSLMTGSLISMFGFTYGTLGLWSSVVSSAACALAWFTLAWQQWRADRKKRVIQ